jgi:hypothetical protein
MTPLCIEEVDGVRYDSGQAPLMNVFFYCIALKVVQRIAVKVKKNFTPRVKPCSVKHV